MPAHEGERDNRLSFEASAVTTATPDAVFDAWIDVDRWAETDAIQRASIDREFGPQAVIKSKARGFPTSTLVVTIVERPARWVDESHMPGVTMTFDHTAVAEGSSTRVTERVTFSGPLARIAASLVRTRLLRLMATSTASVAQRAAERT